MYPSVPKRRDRGPRMPSLFDEDPDPAPVPNPAAKKTDRMEAVRTLLSTSARLTIDACKPIAVAVAKAKGDVTAETFRLEAEAQRKLPTSNDKQRALAWIPVMFAELCRERVLRKRKRADGSVVQRYSKRQNNNQVVYELEDGCR